MGPRPDLDVGALLDNLGIDDHGLRLVSVDSREGVESGGAYLMGQGPALASTSAALQPHPTLVWDVNGYYRSLGFSWPYRPTRPEIRRALIDNLAWVEASAERSYGARLLLNPRERARYDRLPLGGRHLDPATADRLKGDAYLVAAQMTREVGREVSADEVLDSWGLSFLDGPEEDEPESEEPDPDAGPWPWSFYCQNQPLLRIATMRKWQSLLCVAWSHHLTVRPPDGLTTFAVGMSRDLGTLAVATVVDGGLVLLLDDKTQPTAFLAESLVSSVLRDDAMVLKLIEASITRETNRRGVSS